MQMKNKVKSEKGSMTVYVTVAVVTFTIILTAVFSLAVATRKNQIKTLIKIKEVYEQDNSKKEELHNKIKSQLYIKNGLTLQYDAINNTGSGHDNITITWKDLSGKSGNATVTGSSWYKNYLLLDGVDDYATIPYSQTLAPTEFTIDLTFSKQSIVKNSRSVLFVKWFGYTIELNADNTVVFGTRQSTSDFPYLSGGTIQLKKTYNVVATYKDNVESIYINGVLKNRRTNTSSAFSHSNNPLTIGRYQTSSYSNVKINQMKLYGKALTEEEITHNYNYDKQKFNIE